MTDKELRERATKLLDGESYKERVDAIATALKDAYRRGMEAMRGAAFDAWMNGDKRRGWQPFEEAAARLLEGARE